MIDVSQEEILILIWRSFSSGLILGVVYECIRFVKLICGIPYLRNNCKQVKSGSEKFFFHSITFLFDVLFCILVSLVSIILIYHIGDGVFRGIIYISIFTGLSLYYFTIGKVLLKMNIKFSGFVRRVIRKSCRIILMPINFICSLIIKLYHLTIGKFIDKIIDDIKNNTSQRNGGDGLSVENLSEQANKEDRAINENNGYRKQNRINFGARDHQ